MLSHPAKVSLKTFSTLLKSYCHTVLPFINEDHETFLMMTSNPEGQISIFAKIKGQPWRNWHLPTTKFSFSLHNLMWPWQQQKNLTRMNIFSYQSLQCGQNEKTNKPEKKVYSDMCCDSFILYHLIIIIITL